LAVVKV